MHQTKVRSAPYSRGDVIWEGTCSCGHYTGKCISEAEANFRLQRHLETMSPST